MNLAKRLKKHGPKRKPPDSAVDLQVTDHALDAVALAIHAPVPADFGLAIGFGRNAGTDAGLMQAGADDW